jgi:DNA ligase-1
LCSELTAALLRSRFRLAENRLESVAFHVPLVREGFRLRLLPAGHIPGSAMLHRDAAGNESGRLELLELLAPLGIPAERRQIIHC